MHHTQGILQHSKINRTNLQAIVQKKHCRATPHKSSCTNCSIGMQNPHISMQHPTGHKSTLSRSALKTPQADISKCNVLKLSDSITWAHILNLIKRSQHEAVIGFVFWTEYLSFDHLIFLTQWADESPGLETLPELPSSSNIFLSYSSCYHLKF